MSFRGGPDQIPEIVADLAERVRLLESGRGRGIIRAYTDPATGLMSDGTSAWRSTGTQPSLGDGTLTCLEALDGKRLWVAVMLVWGSTTSGGTGDWTIALPPGYTTHPGGILVIPATARDATGSRYSGVTRIAPSATEMGVIVLGASTVVTVTAPITWAVGDTFSTAGDVPLT